MGKGLHGDWILKLLFLWVGKGANEETKRWEIIVVTLQDGNFSY